MSSKFSITCGRSEVYTFDPTEILCDEAVNGRSEAHDAETLDRLVQSYSEVGQLQPILITKNDEGKPVVVAGFRRLLAARKFNEANPDKPMKIKASLQSGLTDEEAFVRNVVENNERKITTPIDDAHNIVRLQNDFGWDDKKVAELYKKGVAFVKKTKAYLDLPEKARVQMHAGNLSRAAANALLDLPSEKQDEILNKTSDKVEIMAEAAEALRTQGNKKGRKLVVYRNFKEIKRFLMEAAAGKNKVVSEAASIILDVVRGVVSEEEAHTRLEYLSSK